MVKDWGLEAWVLVLAPEGRELEDLDLEAKVQDTDLEVKTFFSQTP